MSRFGDFDGDYDVLAKIVSDLAQLPRPTGREYPEICLLCDGESECKDTCPQRRAIAWRRLHVSVVE